MGREENHPAAHLLSEGEVTSLNEQFTCEGHNVTSENFFTSECMTEKLKLKESSFVGEKSKTSWYPTLIMKHGDYILTVNQGE